jgi:type II secretory pathway component PulK
MRHRRGSIFITALALSVVLAGLLLVFAQEMRTEVIAASNRVSSLQADEIEQGAEQWVLAQIETNSSTPTDITDATAEQLQLGNGYFWVLRPDPARRDVWGNGISDESGKVNPNSLNGRNLMLKLPGMNEIIADSLADWVDGDDNARTNGAETSYYMSLEEPYRAKNARLETVEEMLLVKGMTKDLLYGSDLNHDGVLDEAEQKVAGPAAAYGTGGGYKDDGRGIYPFLTVYSIEPNVSTATGERRLNINNGNPFQARTAIRNLLTTVFTSENGLDPSRVNTIMNNLNAQISPQNSPYFTNLGVFYQQSKMTVAEFKQVADRVSVVSNTNLRGMINVNTAPPQVLATLPGLDASDADALARARTTADTGSYAWIFDTLPAQKAVDIAGYLTVRSYQYSADIVAVSGDGRAFKRVKIVVDARTSPAQIIYRKDLTNLGWPLDPAIRDGLRAGQQLTAKIQAGSTTGAK